MPTLVWADGFEHQITGSATPPAYGTSIQKLYDLSGGFNATNFSYVTGRRSGTYALQMAQPGSSICNWGKSWVGVLGGASGTDAARTCVAVFWFKVSTKPTFATTPSSMLMCYMTTGGNIYFGMNNGGDIGIWHLGAGNQMTSGTDYADGNWHRVDIKFDFRANPWLVDWKVDTVAKTQLSDAFAAEDIASVRIGTSQSAHNLTVAIDDWALSATAADYTLPEYEVGLLVPNADGTHSNATAGLAKSTGGTTDSWNVLEEMPPTTTDYVLQANTASGEYLEIEFQDPTDGMTIDYVAGIAALFAAGTTANNGGTRFFDSGGTQLLDLYTGDQSDASLRYQGTQIPDPGGDGWSVSDLSGVKARIGFSSDANPDPYWAALGLIFAYRAYRPEPPFINQTAVVYTPTVNVAAAGPQPPFISSNVALTAPSVTRTVTVAFINQTAVVYTPTGLELELAVPFINQTAVVYAPGFVRTTAVYAAFISSNTTVYAPGFVRTTAVYAPFIDQTAVVYAPVAANVAGPPFIDQTAQVFAPSVARNVTAAFINQSAQVFAPTTKLAVSPGQIASSVQLFAPEARTTAVYAPFINQAAQVFAPLAGTSGVYAPLIASNTQVFTPDFVRTVAVYAPFIDDTAVVYIPATGNVAVPPAITSLMQVFAPSVLVAINVTAPFIASSVALYAPQANRTVTAPFINQAAVVYVPQAYIPGGALQVSMPFISAHRWGTDWGSSWGSSVFAPSVGIGIVPAIQVSMPFISRWYDPWSILSNRTKVEKPAGAVTITAGVDDPQTVIDANPAGTTYWFDGLFNMSYSIEPKSGDSLLTDNAILDGGLVFTSGDRYTAGATATCTEFGIDIKQGTSDNGVATGVTVQGFEIRGFVQGIRCWLGTRVRYCIVHDCIQNGIGGGFANTTWAPGGVTDYQVKIEDTILYENGSVSTTVGTDVYNMGSGNGGLKWGRTGNGNDWKHAPYNEVVVSDPDAGSLLQRVLTQDNQGNGVWTDVTSGGDRVVDVYALRNSRKGIFYPEVSVGPTVVEDCTLKQNAHWRGETSRQQSDAGLQTETSLNITFRRNRVTGNGIYYHSGVDYNRGIKIGQQDLRIPDIGHGTDNVLVENNNLLDSDGLSIDANATNVTSVGNQDYGQHARGASWEGVFVPDDMTGSGVFPPSISPVQGFFVSVPFIDRTPQLFLPTALAANTITPPLIASGVTLFAPATSRGVRAPFFLQGFQVFVPDNILLSQRDVQMPFIASSVQTFEPVLATVVKTKGHGKDKPRKHPVRESLQTKRTNGRG